MIFVSAFPITHACHYWSVDTRRYTRLKEIIYSLSQIAHHDLCFMLLNTLRPRQNGRHFADDTFKRIFLNENIRISIRISLKFVPNGPINNIPALIQIMDWRRPDDKPLSEPMMVRSLYVKHFGTQRNWSYRYGSFVNVGNRTMFLYWVLCLYIKEGWFYFTYPLAVIIVTLICIYLFIIYIHFWWVDGVDVGA